MPRLATSADPIEVAGITVTNPDRVLDPAGITKIQLARYFESVAQWMLPHLAGRPLTLVRCPQGTGGAAGCFYQKHPEPRGWPEALGAVTIEDREGPAVYSYVRDTAGLVALAQLGTLEVHAWNSLVGAPEVPDRIVLDLDPGPGATFKEVVVVARMARASLAALGLEAFVKTTGGRGLHVVTPITAERGFDEVRAFARSFVGLLERDHPDLVIAQMAKTLRPGRVFADYLRNAHGATAVCAYSTRARPGVHVSVPVAWGALSRLDPSDYDVRSVPRRLAALRRDPWDGYEVARHALSAEMISAVGR